MEVDGTTQWIIGGFGAVLLILIGWVKQASKETDARQDTRIEKLEQRLDRDQLAQQKTRHKHLDLITENKSSLQLLHLQLEEKMSQMKATLDQHRYLLKTGLAMLNKHIKSDD